MNVDVDAAIFFTDDVDSIFEYVRVHADLKYRTCTIQCLPILTC
jgi:hypothetical protein